MGHANQIQRGLHGTKTQIDTTARRKQAKLDVTARRDTERYEPKAFVDDRGSGLGLGNRRQPCCSGFVRDAEKLALATREGPRRRRQRHGWLRRRHASGKPANN